MEADPIFKGMQRKANVGGIPMIPFFLAITVPIPLAYAINWKILMIIPLLLMIFKLTLSDDDFYFRLWFLERKTSGGNRKWGITTFAPAIFKKRNHKLDERKPGEYPCLS